MRSRIGTESTITTTIGLTELKSHWISLKTELHVLCSLPKSTAGTKQSIFNILSKNKLMLSLTARRLDSRLADEECVLALEKTTPRNPPQQNLYFVCVCHCTGETSLRNRAQQISHCVKRGALASANINHDQPWLAPWKVDQFTLSWIISFQA